MAKNQIMRAVVGIDASNANKQLDQLEKNFQDIKKELTGVVNVNKKLEASNKKLAATVDKLNKKLAQTGPATKKPDQAMGGYTKSVGKTNAAISNASFALQDFITVMQGGGGFERAVLSTTNNLGMMATMLMGPWSGAIAGVTAALASAAIPAIKHFMFSNEESTEAIEEQTEALKEFDKQALENVLSLQGMTAAANESSDALRDADFDTMGLRLRKVTGEIGKTQARIDELTKTQYEFAEGTRFSIEELDAFAKAGVKPPAAMEHIGQIFDDDFVQNWQEYLNTMVLITHKSGELSMMTEAQTKMRETIDKKRSQTAADTAQEWKDSLDETTSDREEAAQRQAGIDTRSEERESAQWIRNLNTFKRYLARREALEKRESDSREKIRKKTEDAISEILDDEDEREKRSLKILRDSLQSKIGTVKVDGQRLVDAIKALNAKIDALNKKQAAKKADAADAIPKSGRGRGGKERPRIDALAEEQARRKAAGEPRMTPKERRDLMQGKPRPHPDFPDGFPEPIVPFREVPGLFEPEDPAIFPVPPPVAPPPPGPPIDTTPPWERPQVTIRGGSEDKGSRQSGPGSVKDEEWRRNRTNESRKDLGPLPDSLKDLKPGTSGWKEPSRFKSVKDMLMQEPDPIMFPQDFMLILKMLFQTTNNGKVNAGLTGEMKGHLNELQSQANENTMELDAIANGTTVRARRNN